MERHRSSGARTTINSAVGQKRSRKSKSNRYFYRSFLGAASRLSFTPGLTGRRLNTTRKAPKSHNIKEKVNPQHVDLLVKNEWHLSYVTPLHKFRHTQLKSYSRQLSTFIAAEKQQGVAVELEGSQSNVRVMFSVVQGMVEGDDDPETVLIQIYSKRMFAKQDEPQKSVWHGLLTCINGSSEYLHTLPEDLVCLPLFGSSGPQNLTSVVKSWFQRTFDCCFGALEINQTSLQWLMALWTNCHTESSIQYLKMIWTLPAVPPLHVTYTVSAQDAWELWSSMRKDPQDDRVGKEDSIDIEDVTRFMRALQSHFYRHFRLDLSAGCLSHVSTALGSASQRGKIKISSSRYMIATLTLLTECALLKMPI